MTTDTTDREATERERALRAVDPRRQKAKYRPRLRMLDDDAPTLAELGTELDHFIEPVGE
jgi:hypothetical protein